MNKLICITLLAFLSCSVRAEQNLCKVVAHDEQADDLRIMEAEFTKEQYQSSIAYLSEFPREIVYSEDLAKTVKSSETWISYDNSLKFVQGYILREIAITNPVPSNINAFCKFLSVQGEYSD